jgi:hypothetical protein
MRGTLLVSELRRAAADGDNAITGGVCQSPAAAAAAGRRAAASDRQLQYRFN